MTEGRRERWREPSYIDTLVFEAHEVFRENDCVDDEQGLHANTLLRSASKAARKLVFVSEDVDPHYTLTLLKKLQDGTPKNKIWGPLRQQGPISWTKVPDIFARVIAEELRQREPTLVIEEERRLSRFRS